MRFAAARVPFADSQAPPMSGSHVTMRGGQALMSDAGWPPDWRLE